ncbi:MAG: DUF2442 domain-containing protein [Deltaproteobacteria bacterium]|nr:DUF2442 domain-containing protein [Deltaproteobacteria bacterium]
MDGVPRILSVVPLDGERLRVRFDDGREVVYDCRPLFSRPRFAPLTDPAFFRLVAVDPGGYGVSWNDEIDLSEYELRTNGVAA